VGIFDAFGSLFSPDVAGPINQGLTTGYNLAQPNLEQGLSAIQQGYGSAIPALTSNYQAALPYFNKLWGTAQGGIDQLKSALGFGPQGAAGMLDTLKKTPGFEFLSDTGIENAMRKNAALSGGGNSGTLLKDITDYSQGLASTTYNNYISQLQPFLNLGTQAATGAGNILTGIGSGAANLYSGMGKDIAGAYGNLANLGWGYGTGQGAAGSQQAAIDAQYGSSILGGLGKMLTTAIPGGSVLGGLGSGISSGIGSVAGMLGPFSDVRLKDDIAPVGRLYDGTNIWRFTYKDDPHRIAHVGVMAQEIERDRPDAVVHDSAGWKHVDYHKATSRAAQLARFAEAA
jgi:Chaperone of endosialidase